MDKNSTVIFDNMDRLATQIEVGEDVLTQWHSASAKLYEVLNGLREKRDRVDDLYDRNMLPEVIKELQTVCEPSSPHFDVYARAQMSSAISAYSLFRGLFDQGTSDITDLKLKALAQQDLSMCCNTVTNNENVAAYISRLVQQLAETSAEVETTKASLAKTQGKLDALYRRMGDKLSFVQDLFDKNLLPAAALGVDLIDAVPGAVAVLKKQAEQANGGPHWLEQKAELEAAVGMALAMVSHPGGTGWHQALAAQGVLLHQEDLDYVTAICDLARQALAKYLEMRRKGRGGWQTAPLSELMTAAESNLASGDFVDVVNFLAMMGGISKHGGADGQAE